ncbi:MAG: amino acid permease, partial [Sphingobacteriia bacterium]|nr:amino acid permease [Sphingobacteriia bacterium]
LAWTMITAEMPFAMAKDKEFPKAFATENKVGSPSVSLWITSLLMQLGMLLVYFSNNAWNTMLSITGVMVLPAYLTSVAYLWKICEDGEYPQNASAKRSVALITSVLGCVYAIWLIYAAGLSYLLMAIIFLAVGIPVFIWARKENPDGQPIFTKREISLAVIIVGFAIFAIYAFARGIIKV